VPFQQVLPAEGGEQAGGQPVQQVHELIALVGGDVAEQARELRTSALDEALRRVAASGDGPRIAAPEPPP